MLRGIRDPRFRAVAEAVLRDEVELRLNPPPGASLTQVVTPACEVLEAMGEQASIPLLIRAMPVTRVDSDERKAVCSALETLTGRRFGSTEAWWKWYVEEYQASVDPTDGG